MSVGEQSFICLCICSITQYIVRLLACILCLFLFVVQDSIQTVQIMDECGYCSCDPVSWYSLVRIRSWDSPFSFPLAVIITCMYTCVHVYSHAHRHSCTHAQICIHCDKRTYTHARIHGYFGIACVCAIEECPMGILDGNTLIIM